MEKVILKIDHSEEKSSIVKLIIGGLFETKHLDELKKWAEEVQGTIARAHMDRGQKIKVLIDIRELKGYTDAEVLTILGALMKADNPHVLKTASFGGEEMHEIAQDVIQAFAGRDNLKNFKTEKLARAWLDEVAK